MSAISWLENNTFLTTHTPSQFDSSQPPDSVLHVVSRSSPAQFLFQKISDPSPPYGLNRSPPHHFFLRLKDFPPGLQDLLIVASTASVEIGLLSKSKTPLVTDKPADRVSNVFTMTEMANDARRAQLPPTEEMTDTSPIGIALDLSSTDKVLKPIPSEEYDESPTPLPGVMVLNNDGVLSSWWIIYNDSIRQGTAYPGLVAIDGAQQGGQIASVQATEPKAAPTFGTPVSQVPSGQSAFGKPSTTSAFGGTSSNRNAGPTFGSPSFGAPSAPGSTFGVGGGLARTASPWGTPASSSLVNTTPASSIFGSSTTATGTPNIAFGSSAFPGNKTSPWTSGSKPAAPAFGQPSNLTAEKSSPFGGVTSSGAFGGSTLAPTSSGGFASFANGGGFAAAAANKPPSSNGSIFASKSTGETGTFGAPASGKGATFGNGFGASDNRPSPASGSLFGGQGFTLGSTFKGDGSSKDDIPKPAGDSSNSLFGKSFGNVLSTTQSAPEHVDSPEADMDADEHEPQPSPKPEATNREDKGDAVPAEGFGSTTPSTTPAVLKFGMQDATPPVQGNLFGIPPAPTPPSAAVKPAGFSFGTPSPLKEVTVPGKQDNPFTKPLFPNLKKEASKVDNPFAKTSTLSSTSGSAEQPKIKAEPSEDESASDSLKEIPEAPLPPDTTSKASYAVGNSSSSSDADVPLPPDFIIAPPKKQDTSVLAAVPEEFGTAKKLPPISADSIPLSDVHGELEDEGDESGFETEEDEDDNSDFDGSGEDVTKDLSPSPEEQQTPAFTPEASFKSGSNPNRGQPSSFLKISGSTQSSNSRTLFGEISNNKAPVLPPPKNLASPRSPSPVRGVLPGRLLRPDSSRSVSAPGAASQILSRVPPTGPSSTFGLSREEKQEEERWRAQFEERRKASEAQALIDDEDESIQQSLREPLIASRYLDEFVAHNNQIVHADRNSIPAQVEAVFRDINSMLDTLGINSRALQCFIKGQIECTKNKPRTKMDLERADDWCLIEIEDLDNIITKDLTQDLAQGRITNLEEKVAICEGLERELSKLRSKRDDINCLINTQLDPSQVAANRTQNLTSEQAVQQHDLRREFTTFQKLLTDVEESLTLLRARLASQTGSNGKGGSGPTVEAVMKTIAKMTSMAEKRSGDIDVLENQMRKLRMSSVMSEPRSREGSPFATPLRKSAMHLPGTASSNGAFYTPDSARHESPSRFRNSLASSVNSYARGSPNRKKLSGFSEEDKLQLKTIAAQKKHVVDKLRVALQNSGTRMRLMDGDDINGE